MGVSTDAIVAFGFLVDEPDSDEGMEDCEKLDRMMEEGTEEDDELGVSIVYHCSDSYTMYIVAITSSVVRALRGHPKKLHPYNMHKNFGADLALRRYAEKHGLKYKDPAWWLVSYWG